jgi:1-deoxyxylulose-5-phosphate synthase
MAQVALAWMFSKPVITAPIIGATKPHHLEEAVAAVSLQLSSDEIRHLEEAYQPHPILGYA